MAKCVRVSYGRIVRVDDTKAEALVRAGGQYTNKTAWRKLRQAKREQAAIDLIIMSVRRGQRKAVGL